MIDILQHPRQQRFIKISLPFTDEISWLPIIKLPNVKTGCSNMIKVKFVRNTGFPDKMNNASVTYFHYE